MQGLRQWLSCRMTNTRDVCSSASLATATCGGNGGGDGRHLHEVDVPHATGAEEAPDALQRQPEESLSGAGEPTHDGCATCPAGKTSSSSNPVTDGITTVAAFLAACSRCTQRDVRAVKALVDAALATMEPDEDGGAVGGANHYSAASLVRSAVDAEGRNAMHYVCGISSNASIGATSTTNQSDVSTAGPSAGRMRVVGQLLRLCGPTLADLEELGEGAEETHGRGCGGSDEALPIPSPSPSPPPLLDLSLVSPHYGTSLHLAIASNDPEVFAVLLNAVVQRGLAPRVMASTNNNNDNNASGSISRSDAGASCSRLLLLPQTPLHCAIAHANVGAAMAIIATGVDVNLPLGGLREGSCTAEADHAAPLPLREEADGGVGDAASSPVVASDGVAIGLLSPPFTALGLSSRDPRCASITELLTSMGARMSIGDGGEGADVGNSAMMEYDVAMMKGATTGLLSNSGGASCSFVL